MLKKLAILSTLATLAQCQQSKNSILDVVSTNKTVQNIILGYLGSQESWIPYGKISIPRAQTGPVSSIAFSTDGNHLAIRSSKKIYILDVETLNTLKILELDTNDSADSFANKVAYSPNGAYLLTQSMYRPTKKELKCRITIWDGKTYQPIHAHQFCSSNSWSFAFSPDGTIIATGKFISAEPDIQLWDAKTLKKLPLHSKNKFPSAQLLTYSPDGKTIVACDGLPGIWDAQTLEWRTYIDIGKISDIVYSPNNAQIAISSVYDDITIVDAKTFKPIKAITRSDDNMREHTISYSPDSKYLIVGSGQFVDIWDTAQYSLHQRLPSETQDAVFLTAYAPTGTYIAACSSVAAYASDIGFIITIWKAADYKKLILPEPAVAMAPDQNEPNVSVARIIHQSSSGLTQRKKNVIAD